MVSYGVASHPLLNMTDLESSEYSRREAKVVMGTTVGYFWLFWVVGGKDECKMESQNRYRHAHLFFCLVVPKSWQGGPFILYTHSILFFKKKWFEGDFVPSFFINGFKGLIHHHWCHYNRYDWEPRNYCVCRSHT